MLFEAVSCTYFFPSIIRCWKIVNSVLLRVSTSKQMARSRTVCSRIHSRRCVYRTVFRMPCQFMEPEGLADFTGITCRIVPRLIFSLQFVSLCMSKLYHSHPHRGYFVYALMCETTHKQTEQKPMWDVWLQPQCSGCYCHAMTICLHSTSHWCLFSIPLFEHELRRLC